MSDCPKATIDISAKGKVSGSAIKIVTGWSHDSNWAARTRYMKMIDSTKASRKFLAALPISLEVPVVPVAYVESSFSALTSRSIASIAACWE